MVITMLAMQPPKPRKENIQRLTSIIFCRTSCYHYYSPKLVDIYIEYFITVFISHRQSHSRTDVN